MDLPQRVAEGDGSGTQRIEVAALVPREPEQKLVHVGVAARGRDRHRRGDGAGLRRVHPTQRRGSSALPPRAIRVGRGAVNDSHGYESK